jgi:TRAP-type mannitol/chloroaromatic compound transport system substrate-binding protein
MKRLYACAALGTALMLSHAAFAAEAIKWKMMTLWSAGTAPYSVFVAFTENVKKKSNGRLVIEPLPGGSIVPPTESLDAVSSGILDAENGGGAYAAGKEPAFALLADMQGGFENPKQMQQWIDTGGGLQVAREVYKRFNVFFVGGAWYGMESLVSKKPLRSVADFKGVKMRAPVGIGQDIFKKLGAAPVNIPGSEVYTSLERGVIDASDWSTLSMNDELGYHKLAKYPTYPGFHSMPMGDVSVNMKKWNALPDDLKKLLEESVREFSDALVQKTREDDEKVAQSAKQRGFEPINWSPEERKKFRAVAQEVWKEYASRSESAKKVYDSATAAMKKQGLIQ